MFINFLRMYGVFFLCFSFFYSLKILTYDSGIEYYCLGLIHFKLNMLTKIFRSIVFDCVVGYVHRKLPSMIVVIKISLRSLNPKLFKTCSSQRTLFQLFWLEMQTDLNYENIFEKKSRFWALA